MATKAIFPAKRMTIGEAGSAIAFAALALGCTVIAAKAHTAAYAFHACLFAAGSVAAVFAIINNYYNRGDELPPLMVGDKPNYNMGPVKFATVASVIWGGGRISRWRDHRFPDGLSDPEFRHSRNFVWSVADTAYIGGDLRLWR